MSIRRTKVHADHFTIIPNDWARDVRLSFKARGLLGYLLSHSVGWEVTIEWLATQGPDGKDAIRSAVSELEASGYLQRTRTRNEQGHLLGTDYVLTDPTDVGKTPTSENPTLGNPYVGESATKKTIPSENHHSEKHGRTRATPTAIPADWKPSQKALDWALEHYPNVDWSLETKRMVEYFSRPGSAKRATWDRTWMNWVARSADRLAEQPKGKQAAFVAGTAPWW